MSAERFLAGLRKVKKTGPGRWQACCPVHEDRTASLLVTEKPDGKITFYCFALCDKEAILSAVGMKWSDLFPPRPIGSDYHPPERRPFHAEDVLKALEHEVLVAYLMASDAAKSLAVLSDEQRASIGFGPADMARLFLAVERIRSAVDLATGRSIDIEEERRRIVNDARLRPQEEKDLEAFINA
jgi:hypothetical protein